jgi:hypothetical protein
LFFEIGSFAYALASLDKILFVLPCMAEMTGTQQPAQLLVKMMSCKLFALGWSQTAFLLSVASGVAGITADQQGTCFPEAL